MKDLLQENLYYLEHNKKDFFEQIKRYLETKLYKNCKLVNNEDGKFNLTYVFSDGIRYLYSEDESDIDHWLTQYSSFRHGKYDVVMYGLGLSKHLARMIEFNPMLEFYIIEPEIDIFVEALKVINIEQLLKHPQIRLLSLGNGVEEIRSFHVLLNTYSTNVKIDAFIPYYTNIDMETIRQYYNDNYTFRESNLLEMGFAQNFGTLPYRNSIRNLVQIQKNASIASLKNIFDGYTALIVGAGPSLELDIELIKQNKDKVLIIAAGSSIQSLLHYGVRPHLIVSMDPGEANARVFRNTDTKGIPLVYVPQIHSEILTERGSNNIFAFFRNDPIINYLLSDIKVDYAFKVTNSVTGTAIQVAHYLGTKKIMLAGQDLSFPNEKYYARGAKHIDTDKLNNTISASNLSVENVKGSMNPTNISMKSTLENIEALIASIEEVEFINTTSLGAKIKGAAYIPIEEAIKNTESVLNFDELSLLSSQNSNNENPLNLNLCERIQDVCNKCYNLIQVGKNSLNIISKIDELSRKNPNKAMNLLVKLENEFSKITKDSLFKTLSSSWIRIETKMYDQNVIKVEKELTIIGKSKLLNEIVVPYIKVINQSLNDIAEEFEKVKLKIK